MERTSKPGVRFSLASVSKTSASLLLMEAHFFQLRLRMLGLGLWLEAEPAENTLGPDHALRHLRPVRFRTESEALRALGTAEVGQWSSFPHDGVHATLSRTQLRTLGFRGNF